MSGVCSATAVLILSFVLLFPLLFAADDSPRVVSGSIAHQATAKKARIYFAADDTGKLYINGEFVTQTNSPKTLRTVSVSLKAGDVVGLLAKDIGGGYGAIMTIVMPNGVRYRTGRADFIARESFRIPGNQLAWTRPQYNACSWPEAPLSPASDQSIGKPSVFPAPMAGAQYVWADSAASFSSVFLRFRIGGESCNARLSRVYLAADDSARLFVNGRFIVSVSKPNVLVQSRNAFKKGDVIAIQATDIGRGYGVIAAIITPALKILTGSAAWKAHARYNMPAGLPANAWTKPDFSVCSWPAPVLAPKGYAIPPSFPEDMNGATYVWASNAAGGNSIYLRYRIGGESCAGKQVRISFTADNRASLYVNGKFIAVNNVPTKVTSVQVQLTPGAVVGILAKDNGMGYGVRAAIVDGTKTFVTGSPQWRARTSFQSQLGYFAWTRPSFKQCFPVASTIKNVSNIIKPTIIPAELKPAKYVWAKNAGSNKTIFLRFRYGGGC